MIVEKAERKQTRRNKKLRRSNKNSTIGERVYGMAVG